GITWAPVPESGDISNADSTTRRIMFRIEVWGDEWPQGSGLTPRIFSLTAIALQREGPQEIYFWWILLTAAAIAGLIGFILITKGMRGQFYIQEVLLIHNNGLLLARASAGKSVKVDHDIFSGMLTAVLDFVDDSFESGLKDIKKFDLKDYSILIKRGNKSYLAIAYAGSPPGNIENLILDLMTRIENIYGTRIAGFAGDSNSELAGIEILLNDFMEENTREKKNDNSTNGLKEEENKD
ncbi:MAG: hypothetical protein OEV21_05480, partial [Thermoplasmata archaeon]|nr:hypothetical protein [Thermoplasmata archaeon]